MSNYNFSYSAFSCICDEYVMHCKICYHLHSLKTVKNAQGGGLLLLKLHPSACNFTKSNNSLGVFFCANGTKSRKAFYIFLQVMMIDKSSYSFRTQKKCGAENFPKKDRKIFLFKMIIASALDVLKNWLNVVITIWFAQ